MRYVWFRERIPGLEPAVERVHECRHCGESVRSRTDSCPVCGRSAIATYEIR